MTNFEYGYIVPEGLSFGNLGHRASYEAQVLFGDPGARWTRWSNPDVDIFGFTNQPDWGVFAELWRSLLEHLTIECDPWLGARYEYEVTHIIPEATLRAVQQGMAGYFASCGGNPDGMSFKRAAVYVELAKLRQALASLQCPYRLWPWRFTADGSVEIITAFKSEANMHRFQTWQQNAAVDGEQV